MRPGVVLQLLIAFLGSVSAVQVSFVKEDTANESLPLWRPANLTIHDAIMVDALLRGLCHVRMVVYNRSEYEQTSLNVCFDSVPGEVVPAGSLWPGQCRSVPFLDLQTDYLASDEVVRSHEPGKCRSVTAPALAAFLSDVPEESLRLPWNMDGHVQRSRFLGRSIWATESQTQVLSSLLLSDPDENSACCAHCAARPCCISCPAGRYARCFCPGPAGSCKCYTVPP
jgi:hypothetical protein